MAHQLSDRVFTKRLDAKDIASKSLRALATHRQPKHGAKVHAHAQHVASDEANPE